VVQDWAPVASTALAAAAAAAAWLNVRQSRRHWLDAQRPVLVPQVVDNETETRIELAILNAGPGAARGVRFCLVLGGEFVAGYAGPNLGALLRTDESRTIKTQLSDRGASPACVTTCLDSVDRVHVFDLHGGHIIHSPRAVDQASGDPVVAFRAVYPDIDLDEMTQVGGAAARKDPAAR
jgi:hypothetical protein